MTGEPPPTGPADRDPDPGARLAPGEEQALQRSVVRVGRRDRGPVVVAVLVAAAFLLGLLRPWDVLTSGPSTEAPARPVASRESDATGDGSAAARTPAPAPARPPTCAYPAEWRTSTIEDWAGRQARVWKAAEVVHATGPDDPAIPFEPIVAATVTAIGWCAPVHGTERPPLALHARLFRVREGVATEIRYDRLEPAQPDALGELWVPPARSVGIRPPWPMGRYVIELRSDSGSYLRYLGLELTDHVERVRPARPSAVPSAAPSP